MSGREDFEKAMQFLRSVIIREQAGVAYWA